jgi:uncharacterized protein (DUF427 family)
MFPRESPGRGQESVWDYPRPPRLEKVSDVIKVELFGRVVVESQGGFRLLETSHPPTYYVPFSEVWEGLLQPSATASTLCEFKGWAQYWDAVQGSEIRRAVAWSYPDPRPDYAALRGCVAFYPSRVEACYLNGERVVPQEGDFYGGWITARLVGPFKGGPGTRGW